MFWKEWGGIPGWVFGWVVYQELTDTVLLWYTCMVFVVAGGDRGVLEASVGWVFLTGSQGRLRVEYFDFTNKMGILLLPYQHGI